MKRGVERLLRSATAYKRWPAQNNFYREGRSYLNEYRLCMRYCEYQRLGPPSGSGVTEAACETVFTQRLKRSGMRWSLQGGRTAADLRTLKLSGVLERTSVRSLRAKNRLNLGGFDERRRRNSENAAQTHT